MSQDNARPGREFFVCIYIVDKYYKYVLLILRDLVNLVSFDILCNSSLFCTSFATTLNTTKSIRCIHWIGRVRVWKLCSLMGRIFMHLLLGLALRELAIIKYRMLFRFFLFFCRLLSSSSSVSIYFGLLFCFDFGFESLVIYILTFNQYII